MPRKETMKTAGEWFYRGIMLLIAGLILNKASDTYILVQRNDASQQVINKQQENFNNIISGKIESNKIIDDSRYVDLVNKINAVPSELFYNNPYFKSPHKGQSDNSSNP